MTIGSIERMNGSFKKVEFSLKQFNKELGNLFKLVGLT